MENNNIYLPKKDFYSAMIGILTFIFLTLFDNRSESNELRYILFFFIGAVMTYYLYKCIKEKIKDTGTRR